MIQIRFEDLYSWWREGGKEGVEAEEEGGGERERERSSFRYKTEFTDALPFKVCSSMTSSSSSHQRATPFSSCY